MSSPTTPEPSSSRWTWAALAISLLASAGSFYLSVVMGLMPCPLCFYQRAFMLGAFGVLAVGLVAGPRSASLGLLALPLAAAGLAVAAIHVNLERVGALECPTGVLGLGTAPQQSLAAFLALLGVLFADVVAARVKAPPAFVALALGLAIGVACADKRGNPQPPPQPTPADAPPPHICRPPYSPN